MRKWVRAATRRASHDEMATAAIPTRRFDRRVERARRRTGAMARKRVRGTARAAYAPSSPCARHRLLCANTACPAEPNPNAARGQPSQSSAEAGKEAPAQAASTVGSDAFKERPARDPSPTPTSCSVAQHSVTRAIAELCQPGEWQCLHWPCVDACKGKSVSWLSA